MRFTALFLLLILSVTFLAGSATAASFSSVKVGIGYDRQRFRLAREVSSVAALAWPVFALVEYRNVSQGDQFAINITPPDSSFSWHGTNVAAASYSRYLLSHLIPLAGTPNEKRTGTWRVTVSHQQDQQALEFQVVAANRSDLDAARAEQASNPGSFDANYRLGAAASMFGKTSSPWTVCAAPPRSLPVMFTRTAPSAGTICTSSARTTPDRPAPWREGSSSATRTDRWLHGSRPRSQSCWTRCSRRTRR